jgi:hypothetical protein
VSTICKVYCVVDKFELCVDFWEIGVFFMKARVFGSIVEKCEVLFVKSWI